MAKFFNRIDGGLYMGPSPLWGDAPVDDALFVELREYPAHLRVEARELLRLRSEAEAAADALDAAVAAFNAALNAHEDAMASLVDLKSAGAALLAAGGEYPTDTVAAAEKAADESGAMLDKARAAMDAARGAYDVAVQAVTAASARLNSHAA